MSERDYYEILGLAADADGTTVNKTYWNLARKYQALATSDPRAHSMLDELNEAYVVLGTPALRDQYDADRPEPASNEVVAEDYPGWKAFVAPTAREGDAARRSPLALLRGTPYVAGAVLAIVGAGIGLWAGNVLLAVLGGTTGAAVVIALARHKLLAARQSHAHETEPEAVSPKGRPATATQTLPRADQPLSASIVRHRGGSVDELRTSTASMVGRWRASVAGNAGETEHAPDSTLVDIFRSEQEIEAQSEPLSAVLDVLRGSRSAVESR